jgi:hypothetical protein
MVSQTLPWIPIFFPTENIKSLNIPSVSSSSLDCEFQSVVGATSESSPGGSLAGLFEKSSDLDVLSISTSTPGKSIQANPSPINSALSRVFAITEISIDASIDWNDSSIRFLSEISICPSPEEAIC